MSIASVVALILVLATIVSLIPYPAAKKPSLWAYKAVCPFAPYSSAFMLVTAAVIFLIGNLA